MEHITDTIQIAIAQAQIKKTQHTTIIQSTDPLPIAVQNSMKEKHRAGKV